MKINHLDYAGIAFFIEPEWAPARGMIFNEYGVGEVFDNKRFSDYLLTKPALSVIDNIKVEKGFNTAYLTGVLLDKTLLLSENEFIRTVRVSGGVYGMHGINDNGKMDVLDFVIPFDDNTKSEFFEQIYNTPRWGSLKRAIQCLLFLELTEPSVLILPPQKRFSQSPMGYTNTSKSKIFIVDSNWNKYIVRTEGFGVTGHFRLQPHGEKSQLRKLIWVQPFQKHGYVRKPKSETASA